MCVIVRIKETLESANICNFNCMNGFGIAKFYLQIS